MKGITARPRKQGGKTGQKESLAFIDTSVLLYLISSDAHKAAVAESVLQKRGHISVQVLNEFAHVARRKAGLSWPDIQDVLTVVRHYCTVWPLTEAVHEEGLRIVQQHSVSLYDAMIVASAALAGCTTLYSEDMQHGQRLVQQVRVVNPFV